MLNSLSPFCEVIQTHIQSSPGSRISFSEFMEMALYHPQYGYYNTQAPQLGTQGDFFTSVHVGKDFGELLAEQFVEMDQYLGTPDSFTLVEMGAGQGFLAGDILRYLYRHFPAFFDRLHYRIVEKSTALRLEQQRQLQDVVTLGGRVQWCDLEELPAIVGCCFSNELIDAFPVHQVVWNAGQLQEVYVTTVQGEGSEAPFQEVFGELSTSRFAEYFALIEVDFPSDKYPDGYRTEINLAALNWLETIATKLQRGYLLTIDYGYPATRYYSPVRRQGTLQCYYQHTHHSNPYLQIGQQDITAHVDFTALERWGDRLGLQTIGFTQQSLFLMALGLGDRLAELSSLNPQATGQILQTLLQRRDALHTLINPMGLGNFGVLAQGKGLTAAEQKEGLRGFKIPL
ncbi:MAG: class I SAM-dependent methyltransferase [Leptolyngbyaceae cyanobacterium bins.59]|nr:class I SAM-dependent methyltransferase [Leptolyngbyaceae cyanobacterium bins.59]